MTDINTENVLSRTKIYNHPNRLAEWLSTGKTLPIIAEIDPTNLCNRACLECAGNRSVVGASLSLENMKHIVDELYSFIKAIVFTGGGEPLKNPFTPKIIEYTKQKGIDVGLVTNGLSLTPEISKIVLDNCTWVRVSVYDDDFVWKNVTTLISLKKKLGSNCTIGSAYLTSINEDIPSWKSFIVKSKSFGVDYAQLRPYHHSNINHIPALFDLKNIYDADDFKVIFPEDKYKRINYIYERSFVDEFRTVITADGDLYPDCFTRGIKNFSCGNIFEQSFEEIWTSEKRENILNNKLKQSNCPYQCKQDPLSDLLWNMYLSAKDSTHKNFV